MRRRHLNQECGFLDVGLSRSGDLDLRDQLQEFLNASDIKGAHFVGFTYPSFRHEVLVASGEANS